MQRVGLSNMVLAMSCSSTSVLLFEDEGSTVSGKTIVSQKKKRWRNLRNRHVLHSFAVLQVAIVFLWSFSRRLLARKTRIPRGQDGLFMGPHNTSGGDAISWPLLQINSPAQCPLSHSRARGLSFLLAVSLSFLGAGTI